MNRLKYGLLTALLTVLSGACADDYLSLVVIHNEALDDTCVVTGELSSPSLGHGFLELGFGRGYRLTPVVQSNLTNPTDDVNGDIILLQGASVAIEAVDSDASRAAVAGLGDISARQAYFSGSVFPGGTAGIDFEIIDSTQATTLRGVIPAGTAVEVLARVVVQGEVEGTGVSSPAFVYPITLCNGCAGGQVNLGLCSALPAGTVGASMGCFPGQDDFTVECCTDAAGAAVCPAVSSAAP